MNDVICIDSSFPQDALDFYKKHNVITPQQDKMYTVREIITHSIGKKGVLLEEIINPLVPFSTGIISGKREVTWNLNRFRALNGDIISEEVIKQTTKT